MSIYKMFNALIRYLVILSAVILFFIMGWHMYSAYDIHKKTRTSRIPLISHQTESGTIELTGTVYLTEEKWRYFRGAPMISVSGKNLRKYLKNDSKVVFEMITEDDLQELVLTSSLIRKSPNNQSIFEGILVPILTGKKTKFINYRKGTNKIKVTLHDYHNNDLTGEIILDALGERAHVFVPILYAVICFVFALILCYISKIFGAKRNEP